MKRAPWMASLILLGAVLATWIEIRRESRTRHSLEFERPGIQA